MSSTRLTPLRIVLSIVLVAALAVATVAAARSYRARARSEAALAAADAQKPEARLAVAAADDASLREGPLPIDDAIRMLGVRGRLGLGEALLPQQSTDVAPLMGWVYQTRDVPEAMMSPPEALRDAATDGDARTSDAAASE